MTQSTGGTRSAWWTSRTRAHARTHAGTRTCKWESPNFIKRGTKVDLGKLKNLKSDSATRFGDLTGNISTKQHQGKKAVGWCVAGGEGAGRPWQAESQSWENRKQCRVKREAAIGSSGDTPAGGWNFLSQAGEGQR